nr:AbrB/MazE/SpoVT family DNA-binding domain-containing protein [Oceanococcus sp. HetDA_MAG_MS8]
MQTTLTSKGQVVIPQAIRKQMLLAQGSKLEVIVRDGEIILRPLAVPKEQSLTWRSRNPKGRQLSVQELCQPVNLDEE